MSTLILFNKPYQVLSQFSDKENRATLADYISEKNVYPAGRLDYDSEGLLLLTEDGQLQQHIANPKYKLPKTYWVQVEGEENPDAIAQLSKGVILKEGKTQAAKVHSISPPDLWQRHPPVRFRQSIPTHWLSITICEGRNRQVRRMTAAVKLPTLRLIRHRIGHWSLDQLQPGEFKRLSVHLPNNRKAANNSRKRRHTHTKK